MTAKEITEIEELVEKANITTQETILEYKEETKPIAPDCAIGRVSRMDAINNKSVVEAALRVQENKLNGLNYVKSSLHEPDFGLCNRCKNPIPIQRILLVPHNKFCVKCAV
jgi:DnaK suppressor protein